MASWRAVSWGRPAPLEWANARQSKIDAAAQSRPESLQLRSRELSSSADENARSLTRCEERAKNFFLRLPKHVAHRSETNFPVGQATGLSFAIRLDKAIDIVLPAVALPSLVPPATWPRSRSFNEGLAS